MSAQHTPGPWRNHGEYDKLRDEIGAPGKAIAVVWVRRQADGLQRRGETVPSTEGEANARLIAAAPELFEALHDLADRDFVYSGPDADTGNPASLYNSVKRARAAIAKATGEAA